MSQNALNHFVEIIRPKSRQRVPKKYPCCWNTSCNNKRRNECEMAAYVSIKWDIRYTILRWGGGISGPIFAQMLLISRGSHLSIDEKCRIIKERQILYAILNKDFCSYGRGTTARLSAPLKQHFRGNANGRNLMPGQILPCLGGG